MDLLMIGVIMFPIIIVSLLMIMIIRQEHLCTNAFREILAYALIERLNECELRGDITIEEMENINRMYVVYRSIGGGGVVDVMYKRICAICSRKEKQI